MKQFWIIFSLVYAAFLLETSLFNSLGAWAKPEILTLLVVFLTLYLGIRQGIIAAVLAGFWRDGLSLQPWGFYTIAYVSVAYAIIYVRQFIYQPGSRLSRVVMAFFGVVIAFSVQGVLLSRQLDFGLDEMIVDVVAWPLLLTVLISTWLFAQLKIFCEFVRLK